MAEPGLPLVIQTALVRGGGPPSDFSGTTAADTGRLVIEIPGDYIRPLIASLTNLLPKIRGGSPEDQTVAFQVMQFGVMTSDFPDQVYLNLTVAPDQQFAFSLPTSMLDHIAQQLHLAAAEAKKGPTGRKPS
jgi:hypothetical protein